MLANMTPDIQNGFKITGLISGGVLVAHDLDRALEYCEDTIIQASYTQSRPAHDGWRNGADHGPSAQCDRRG
jgi:hypothetical protein